MESLSQAKIVARTRSMIHNLPLPTWATSGLLGGILTLAVMRSWRAATAFIQSKRKETTEPGLFQKYSAYDSFTTTSGHEYPKIRVFYHAHPQETKLPKSIPLLVFMHGLGGNATQFSPLLTSLVTLAPCLAIDLPGCGLSAFKPDQISAYNTQAFAELLCAVVSRYRDAKNNQKVVLIGHSMGASICALLASSTSPFATVMSDTIIGFVAICPRSTPPSAREAVYVQRLKWMPAPLFDIIRMYDRRGGLHSGSITRVVGKGADTETRKLQQKFNAQSKSSVFLKMIIGSMLPAPTESTEKSVGWPGKEIWEGVKVPLFLIAGESDQLTPPDEVEQIVRWLTVSTKRAIHGHTPSVIAKGDPTPSTNPNVGLVSQGDTGLLAAVGDAQLVSDRLLTFAAPESSLPLTESGNSVQEVHLETRHTVALKTSLLPAPAAHALMYSTSTVRILAGLIESFVSRYVDKHLALGWQLQFLTTSGKWDVKNLIKWQSIDPCSEPIGGVFRAMKTMREVDIEHCPKAFTQRFGKNAIPNGVAAVVDISHESPVYDPKGLEDGGVEYHKLPTVSKLPPTADDVDHFISLVDQLRRSPSVVGKDDQETHYAIGVHCHYGFNRTGFVIVCYLVDRLGYKLQDAIDEFATKRAPGIKHEHFVNELYVRYAVKMERRGTIVG